MSEPMGNSSADGTGDPSPIRAGRDAVTITVRVQPRASRNEVVGTAEGVLKVKLQAPPVDGEANAACVDFLSEILAVPRSAVQIISGLTARLKVVRVLGLSAAAAEAAIFQAAGMSPRVRSE